ncbi:ribosome recycling factor [candidate division WWE3 bacterium RIFCSPHIGHO2_02_FULL_38_14]|uniref:Ribosome-recycling factor n=1 Tax=candidate division WWE3 bacterium RIFCSPHIGHO2_02_FULL_38_14 TaxID=1802620 RepID=A0A1F4V755_UNCKA|nr:MAG: ribosome recycling factor [candidate division WWE3 bacterium RIFCSPHIGHO2_02_FULL_38_14]
MNIAELRVKLSKSLEFLKSELNQLRTGRPTPLLIENIQVDAYDTKMTVKELGSISVPDPQNLVVSVWDKTLLKSIAGAIGDSDLKLNPVVDGDVVRVPLPALTEERRKELVKLVSVKVEEAKNTIRSIRQDFMKEIEKAFAEKEIGEDKKYTGKEEVEKVVKEFTEKLDELGENKKEEIMKV